HGTSVSQAQAEISKDPNSAKGYRDLATAYEAKGETQSAISALQQYTSHKPRDAAAWRELGGLQLNNASTWAQQYSAAYSASQLAAPGQAFRPTGKLGTALGTDQVDQVASQDATSSLGNLQQQV